MTTPNTDWRIGDKVNKVKGYQFPGTIVSVFQTLKGDVRYVVEMDGYGLLHIFNGEQLILSSELEKLARGAEHFVRDFGGQMKELADE